MKKYMFIFKRHKGKLIALSLILILSSIVHIVITYIGGIYIDIISTATAIHTIYMVCSFLIFISIANLATKYLVSYIMNPIIENITFDFQYYTLNHLKKTSIIEYKKFNVAYLAKRIEEDSRQISQFFVNNYTSVFIKIIEVIVIMVIVFKINTILGIVMIALCPIYYITYKKFRKPIYEKNLIMREKAAEYFQDYSNHLEYLEDIVIEADYERENDLLVTKYASYLARFKEYVAVNNKFTITQGIIVAVMQITIYLIGGIGVFIGYTTVGKLSILLSYFIQILNNITYYNDLARTYQTTKTAIDRIDTLINLQEIKEGIKHIKNVTSINASVSFAIGNQQILNNINIDARIGDVIGIIGKNGIGKTTLLKLVVGALKLNEDDKDSYIIYNNKHNINDIDSLYLRRKFLAYTPQKIRFRDLTMYEAFNEIDKYNNCNDFIATLHENEIPLPKEIEIFIKQNWNKKLETLSGGDKQMVAILRNVIRKSSILLFDEPTSSLDINRKKWFEQMIYSIKNNRIIFIITHEKKIHSVFDKIINLESSN